MRQLKLLIVEDEALIGLQLKKGLSRAGYSVVGPVATAEDALRLAHNEKPDVVVMDIRLKGGMDGIETARQIGSFSAPWIIFTTGYQDSNLKKLALELGPLAYLVKPLDWQDVDDVVRTRLAAEAGKASSA